MERAGAREFKRHTGEIIERVRTGERVLITHRGEAVVLISPIDQQALREALASEAGRAEQETLGWLAASESAFSFWESEDDAMWDEVADEIGGGRGRCRGLGFLGISFGRNPYPRGSYPRGSMILVLFPFTDLSGRKTRPALVVSAESMHEEDLISCANTSRVPERLSAWEVPLAVGDMAE